MSAADRVDDEREVTDEEIGPAAADRTSRASTARSLRLWASALLGAEGAY
jgi:hypothetical protein